MTARETFQKAAALLESGETGRAGQLLRQASEEAIEEGDGITSSQALFCIGVLVNAGLQSCAPAAIPAMDEAWRRIRAATEASAKELDIGGLDLKELPEEIYELSHLEILYLGCPKEMQSLHYRMRPDYRKNCLGQLPPQLFISLPRLTHLYADSNDLKNLPPEIGVSQKLTVLDLRENHLSDADMTSLAGLPRLTSLDLWGNDGAYGVGVTDQGAKTISRLTSLVMLNLGYNMVGSAGVRALGVLTNLASLDLERTSIKDEGVESLTTLVNLTSLCLSGNDISPKGVSALAGLSKLKSLNLWGIHLGSAGARALKSLTNLQALNLHGARIGNVGAKCLTGLVNLKSLDVSENSLSAKAAESLAKLTGLVSLNLGGNKLGPNGMQALAQLGSLEVLNLRGNRIGDEGLRALSGLTGLTKLDLRGNLITEVSAPLLAEFIKTVTVDLGNNPISKKLARPLAKSTGTIVPNKFLEKKDDIVRKMLKYPDREYSDEDARDVGGILQQYLEAVFCRVPPLEREVILIATKEAVLALNELNYFCDQTLIETDERENICALILTAANAVGLQSDEDITQEWREW